MVGGLRKHGHTLLKRTFAGLAVRLEGVLGVHPKLTNMLVQGKGNGAAPDKGKAIAASKGKEAAQAEKPAASTSGRQAF